MSKMLINISTIGMRTGGNKNGRQNYFKKILLCIVYYNEKHSPLNEY